MVNLIYIDGSGHKAARAVTTREEYFALRNSETNIARFHAARGGSKEDKMKLLQFNYNDLIPDGKLKDCHHAASTFAHDIDCGKEDECKAIAGRILSKKEEIGLLELSVSANWGLHAVCRRQPGKTILENQVRIATLTQTEMDTSTHDEQRVMFTGPADGATLLYLDEAIFEETLTPEESAEEYQRLKEREIRGEEEVPQGAKKANKHYRPGEAEADEVRSKKEEGRSENEENCQLSIVNSQLEYNGIPYADIVRKWWELYNEGKEPVKSCPPALAFELAVTLRHMC